MVPGVGNVLTSSSMTTESPMATDDEDKDEEEIAFDQTSINNKELQKGEEEESQNILQ